MSAAGDSTLQAIQPALVHRPRFHGRTQSTTPSISYPSYHPDSPPSSTGYRGAAGNINDGGPHYSTISLTDDLDFAPSSPTPTRQPLGQRLLSAVSNAQPTAAGLNRSKTVLHSRAKSSFAALVSKANATTNLQDEPHDQQPTRPHKLFGDLFNGESAPVRLGIPPSSPTKEEKEDPFSMPDYRSAFTERPTSWMRRQSATQTTTTTKTDTTNKGSWWPTKRASANPQPSPAPAPAPVRDEILDLNVSSALFPDGPADNCSPAAFNELLANATSLLERLQDAYRGKLEHISTLQPELEEQREVLEASRTQSRLLKEQLDVLSTRGQEQGTAMQEMAAQLAAEKQKSAKLTEAVEASRTIRPVSSRDEWDDEDTTPRRRKRGSAASGSDSGFESDWDADGMSLASGAVSPVNGQLSSPAVAMTICEVRGGEVQRHGTIRRPGDKFAAAGVRASGSPDWAAVEQLRGENLVLKREKMEMQRELQNAIDAIGGIGI